MSDIAQELELDLAREKEKLFLNKYKYHIIVIIVSILTWVVGQQLYQQYQHSQEKKAAANYYQFSQYYDDVETLIDEAIEEPKLSKETIEAVPVYFAMAQLSKYHNAQKHDADHNELFEITKEYIKSDLPKQQTIHDSLLRLYYLVLQIDNVTLSEIEPQFTHYLKHPFAFKAIVYEMLLLFAINENNASKARHYLEKLEQNTSPEKNQKIKLFHAHPLFAVKNKKETL